MATSVKLKKSNLDLAGAVIPRANLSRTNLTAANLEGTNLSGADLRFSILVGANLTKAVLQSADLAHADLSEADLTGADLTGANLSGAELIETNLKGAKFTRANLKGANLCESQNVSWSDLLRAYVDDKTVFPKELDEAQFFVCLQRMAPNLRVDWVAEYSGDVKAAIISLNQQLERGGRGSTIAELLRDAEFGQYLQDENSQTNDK